MAKTLVALYDTFTDAERVVQELIEDGFSRSDLHLALEHTKGRPAHTSSVEWDSAYEGANLIDTLADLGVLPAANDGAEVTRREQRLHRAQRRIEDRAHRRRYQHVRGDDREVLHAVARCLADGRGRSRRRRLESDSEEDHFDVRV